MLGEELAEFRHAQGLSRQELARKMGKSGRSSRAIAEDLRKAERNPGSSIPRYLIDGLDSIRPVTEKVAVSRVSKVPIKKSVYQDILRIVGLSEDEFLSVYEGVLTSGGGVMVKGSSSTLLQGIRRGWWAQYLKDLESSGFDRKYISEYADVPYNTITTAIHGKCKISESARFRLLELANKKPPTLKASIAESVTHKEVPEKAATFRLLSLEYADYLRCGGDPIPEMGKGKKSVMLSGERKDAVQKVRHDWWRPVISSLVKEYGIRDLAQKVGRSGRGVELWVHEKTLPNSEIADVLLELYHKKTQPKIETKPEVVTTTKVEESAIVDKRADLRNVLMSALDAYIAEHMEKNEKAVADRVTSEALDLIQDEVSRQVDEKMGAFKTAIKALF